MYEYFSSNYNNDLEIFKNSSVRGGDADDSDKSKVLIDAINQITI